MTWPDQPGYITPRRARTIRVELASERHDARDDEHQAAAPDCPRAGCPTISRCYLPARLCEHREAVTHS